MLLRNQSLHRQLALTGPIKDCAGCRGRMVGQNGDSGKISSSLALLALIVHFSLFIPVCSSGAQNSSPASSKHTHPSCTFTPNAQHFQMNDAQCCSSPRKGSPGSWKPATVCFYFQTSNPRRSLVLHNRMEPMGHQQPAFVAWANLQS